MPASALSRVGVMDFSMRPSLQIAISDASEKLCSLREDKQFSALQHAKMTDDTDKNGGPNHLRAWREYRGMTQEELGAVIEPPTTGSVISLLEDGERGLSLKWLRRLAPALRTRPGFLADYDPNDLDTRALEMIESIPDEQKEQAVSILETFTRKAG